MFPSRTGWDALLALRAALKVPPQAVGERRTYFLRGVVVVVCNDYDTERRQRKAVDNCN